jgi:hypothetical protein
VRVSLVVEVLALALLGAQEGDAFAGRQAQSLPESVTDPALGEAARAVIARPGFREWSARVASTRYCANPFHLRGVVATLDRQGVIGPTVERRSLMVRCGNRRAAVCPSCSFTYSGDVWQVLAAGVSGAGTTSPPLWRHTRWVFLTLTARMYGG